MKLEFYKCKTCGQVVAIVKKTSAPIICCGNEMEYIEPVTVDEGYEKHVPVYTRKCNKVNVRVGDRLHPNLKEHHIEWIALETDRGCQLKRIPIGEEAKLTFHICNKEQIKNIYSYCNIHGLWKAVIKE